jgi:hypothetical protein
MDFPSESWSYFPNKFWSYFPNEFWSYLLWHWQSTRVLSISYAEPP